MHKQPFNYRGRFAPSPTGELHFGSLLAAMASYADAKVHRGAWLLRIDDIDSARVVKYSDKEIISTLEQFGFIWDENVSYQSNNIAAYNDTLERLAEKGLSYPCTCSRKFIKSLSVNGVYPGICRPETNQKNKIIKTFPSYAIRLNTREQFISFKDKIQQHYSQDLSKDVGDFIIFRADKVHAYQLAVIVDDYLAGINHIVRGFDLISSTPRQIYLQQLLNFPTPEYAHIPIAVNNLNLKISKLTKAKKIDVKMQSLVLAARFLGQKVLNPGEYDNYNDFWQHLFIVWDIRLVPGIKQQIFKPKTHIN